MTPIREMFASLDRPALLPYLTAGLPTPGDSIDLFRAMVDAGADAFEVGIPYSDPLMDGPVIMRASEVALAAGADATRALAVLEQVAGLGTPTLAMTYANPVMQAGWETYCRRLAGVGAVGIIIPDLPFEEAGPLLEAGVTAGVGVVLFVSPTTDPDRMMKVAKAEPEFIYGVSDLGVTGERQAVSEHVAGLSARVRAITEVPLVLGVGISTPEHVQAVRHLADGVIVGTALVRRVLEATSAPEAARALFDAVRDLRAALD